MVSIINAQIVNEGRVFKGSIQIDGTLITAVVPDGMPFQAVGDVIDADGRYVIPGVIDEHVHFREPGLTSKGDILSESRAAAAGGVTSFFDMPNTKPQTTSLEELDNKMALGKARSLVNYAFYIGATDDNLPTLEKVTASSVPAIKLFMGASTGNMLVDNDEALESIFRIARSRNLPVVTHCEDSAQIARNEARILAEVGQDAGVEYHPVIRDEKECLDSTRRAIELATHSGAALLVAHVSTSREIEEIACCGAGNVKAEVCVAYLCFNDSDYPTLGSRIKCNPAIKSAECQAGLLDALRKGMVTTVATDHAPHLLADKEGGVFSATSGMPSVQFSLPLMLQLTDRGIIDIIKVVEVMCHNPSRFFGVKQRGFIREGFKADLVVLNHLTAPHTITDSDVVSKCGWTPYIGQKLNWQVATTICNGTVVYTNDKGIIAPEYRGEAIEFDHDNDKAI